MIYDCFMFFNELDVLEVRLNELDNVVDKFILVEATKTFTNQDKPLWFEKNKQRFAPFLDKIDHIIIDKYPEFDAAWTFENYQRDVIINALKERCQPEDVILISDLDEIPRGKLVEKYKDTEGIKVFEQNLYTFYFNYLNITEPIWLKGTRMLRFKDIGDKTLTEIRFAEGEHIKNGGWHFTYLGGLEMVKYKIRSFAHQEYNNEYYMNENRLKTLIHDGIDIFERGYKYKIDSLDGSFPEYVQKNRQKFQHLILKKSPVLHQIKNALTPSKRQDKRYIDTHKPINDNLIKDFISPSSAKILEVTPCLNIDTLPDNYYDCAVFDGTLGQFIDPQDILSKLRKKLNRNGYVVIKTPNFRHISTLNQMLFKKTVSYKERHFTRKSLFDLIGGSGYYVVTFKGLKPVNTIDYKIKNLLFAGNLYDCKHEEFLCVIKH